MDIFLIAALIFAALEALALQKPWPRLEYVAKPAVMIALFFWLWIATGLNGAAFWFGLGLLLSLAGDVLLMLSIDRLFLLGLVAFLFTHVAYMSGFNSPAPALSAWGLLLAVMIGLGGVRVMRRILGSLAARGQSSLRTPVIIYGLVLSFMLLSAMLKLTDTSWNAGSALLVSLGAFLFYLSDILLAWTKFVALMTNGRLYTMLAYHLGQIVLIAGVVLQYRH